MKNTTVSGLGLFKNSQIGQILVMIKGSAF